MMIKKRTTSAVKNGNMYMMTTKTKNDIRHAVVGEHIGVIPGQDTRE